MTSQSQIPRLAGLPRIGLATLILAFAGDRLTKLWLLTYVDMPAHKNIVITPFFDLVMVWNRGVSFGLFGGGGETQRWVLAAVSLAIVSVLFYWMRQAADRMTAAAFGLVIGGALANVCDRFSFGAVADFFDFHIGGYHWPAFNVADSAITLGVVLILIKAATDHKRPID